MKRIWKFFTEYKQLGLVIIATLVALGLQIAGYHTAVDWILGITSSISVIILLAGMLQDLRDGRYGIDILAATAIIASVALGEFWTSIIIVLMLTGGEALEDYAEHRANNELDALISRAPKKAHVLRGRKTIDVLVSAVQQGDKLVIRPGELVPVDAEVIEGQASLDESSLTGESIPVDKQPGDQLLSGSVNLDGVLTVKALRVAADSQYEQIVKLVRDAASAQSPFVRLADRYSIPFTIIAYVIAGSVWIASGDPVRFLAVIVVATPCPLLLAAPIALVSGMSRSAKQGIIVKNGGALERLANIRSLGFDKTGTLTLGQPVVSRVQALTKKYDQQAVLGIAASLEQTSNHLLAQAIVAAAKKQKLKLAKVRDIKEQAGYGLRGQVNRQEVLVGKASFLQENGLAIPAKYLKDNLGTTSFVAIEDQLVGVISLEDELRPESKNTVTALRKLGVERILMMTGDSLASAKAIAKKVGITHVHADCLPADKLHVLEELGPGDRPVGFVGDGVNDAPVLTAADVGIALGARGSAAASESADVVIMLDDLSQVANALSIAKRTFYIARQSILIGIGISIGLMLIFATGRFKPIYGAALQELVDITVIFNALRAHNGGRAAHVK